MLCAPTAKGYGEPRCQASISLWSIQHSPRSDRFHYDTEVYVLVLLTILCALSGLAHTIHERGRLIEDIQTLITYGPDRGWALFGPF